jgi:hypothetical protein
LRQGELDWKLVAALERLADELAECAQPWWLIGSAAAALHGAREVVVGDIDLLVDRTDAGAILARRRIVAEPGIPDARFRSDVFASWAEGAYRVELFAGFCLRSAGGWRELVPQTRQAVEVGPARLFVPCVAELIAWGRLFGRTKDAEREMLLRPLLH